MPNPASSRCARRRTSCATCRITCEGFNRSPRSRSSSRRRSSKCSSPTPSRPASTGRAIAKNGNSTYSAFQTGPQNGFPQQGFGSNNLTLLNQPSQALTLSPSNPVTSTVTNTLGGAFALAINTGSFASYVEALSTQGKTTVLSSPRVSTLNNQKAVIKAGDDEYFITGVTSNTLVGTSSSQASTLDLAPFFSGVALDVTPQLSEGGEIILHIHPTVSNVSPKILNVTSNGQANSLPLAYSEVREADSVVKAESGQLVVIGGLMQVNRTSQDYRIPVLGDIPLARQSVSKPAEDQCPLRTRDPAAAHRGRRRFAMGETHRRGSRPRRRPGSEDPQQHRTLIGRS